MRMEGIIYPDVYCLPFYFAERFTFVQQWTKIRDGEYDLILSELQESNAQLEYLQALVRTNLPVAVILGPPEILFRNPTQEKLHLIKSILLNARYVWAYSETLAKFFNRLVGWDHATVIPWPFDFGSLTRLASQLVSPTQRKVLFQVPLSFSGLIPDLPFTLKAIVEDVWSDLPKEARRSIRLHTFIYSPEDRRRCKSSNFLKTFPLRVQPKMGYVSFVRFLKSCDAVINLTSGNILGRITFISAALGKPGIFSNNTELNQKLYPLSITDPEDTTTVRHLVRKLLLGVSGVEPHSLLPLSGATKQIGDFERNALTMQSLLKSNLPCAAS